MQTKAIVVNEYGDVDVLQWQSIDLPELKADEVLIEVSAVGFNMIDTYFRKGVYPMQTPFIMGAEAAGVVTKVGADVSNFAIGDRVVSVQPTSGAYAEQRIIPAASCVHIPETIDDQTAAACLLKGLTVQYLLKQTYPVQAGDSIVFYAAAGGVGLIAMQWAKHLDANIIAITGNAEKCELAKQYGANHTIDMQTTAIEDIAPTVRELTDGIGVPVVYDSLGKDTFIASLDCLQTRGLLVSYGNATGPVDNVHLGELAKRGSLYVTRPVLFNYIYSQEVLQEMADDLFDVINKGIVKINIGQTFKLKDAAAAHKAAEGRATQGSTVLVVE